MIQLFLRQIMSIKITKNNKFDATPLVFCYFLYELLFKDKKVFRIDEFAQYVFRFYIDNTWFRVNHSNKVINSISKYSYIDILAYVSYQLDTLIKSVNTVRKNELDIYFLDLNIEISDKEGFMYKYKTIVNTISKKYLNQSDFWYLSQLTTNDYIEFLATNKGRVLNRCLEEINYCFICDDYNIDNLEAVQLINTDDDRFDYGIYNYLVMCRSHASEFKECMFSINKDGFLLRNNEIQPQHLPIEVVKKYRPILAKIQQL